MESSEIIWMVVNGLLAVAILILGGYLITAKKAVTKLRAVIAEALRDGKLEPEEVADILEAVKDVGKIAFTIATIVAERLARKPKP